MFGIVRYRTDCWNDLGLESPHEILSPRCQPNLCKVKRRNRGENWPNKRLLSTVRMLELITEINKLLLEKEERLVKSRITP
jgi:hypothetical protein